MSAQHQRGQGHLIELGTRPTAADWTGSGATCNDREKDFLGGGIASLGARIWEHK